MFSLSFPKKEFLSNSRIFFVENISEQTSKIFHSQNFLWELSFKNFVVVSNPEIKRNSRSRLESQNRPLIRHWSIYKRMAGAGSVWRRLRLVEDLALIFIQTIAMVPAAYLVIKRRARQKKKHEEDMKQITKTMTTKGSPLADAKREGPMKTRRTRSR